jgi:glycosyltransferase involved in cell wall biosynthesis
MKPVVSFLVPCYKLAHLLGECLDSILAQSYTDFEVLILDDCSPDHTSDVVRSYSDPRIRYIHNERNLGHLANYNKGISLARGRYVWLISADDVLHRPYVLERFVSMLEAHPRAGFVFSPAMELKDGKVGGMISWSAHGTQDRVFTERSFLPRLLEGNPIAAPTGMVRKECYEKLGGFPLDLPHAGDWYLWFIFAFHYDVAYCAEPMVCYRSHAQSISKAFMAKSERILQDDAERVRWRIKAMIDTLGSRTLSESCNESITSRHAVQIAKAMYGGNSLGPSLDECLTRIAESARDEDDRRDMETRLYESLGNVAYGYREYGDSSGFYREACRRRWLSPALWAKIFLSQSLSLGARTREPRPRPDVGR